MLKVITSPLAESDLAGIWLEIMPDNIDAADNMLRVIDSSFQLLARFPNIGRCRNNLSYGICSFTVGRYLIFYRIYDTEIEIVRVLHGARDLPNIFGVE